MRAVILGLVTTAATTVAVAGPKKKVRIETTPVGASVFIDAVEEGEQCKTPCTIDIAANQTVIVALEGHKPDLQLITFEKTERQPYKRAFKLKPNLGTLNVTGPKGASVYVDDEDKGKAPLEIEVAAETPHAVVLKLDGKDVYANSVEVKPNDTVDVTGSTKNIATKPTGGGDDPADPADPKPTIRDTARPAGPRSGPIVAVSAAFSVGFRDFAYKDPNTEINDNLNPENEYGQITAGALAEFWPGTLAGVKALRGAALLVRYQHNVNAQVVEQKGMPTEATTFWRSFEVSARQRWTISDAATVEVGAGYVRDEHSFGGNKADIEKVPDVTYTSVRIGARLSALLGSVEPYGSIENRIVLSGGALEDRFPMGADANGLCAAVGLAARFGSVGARVEGSISRYSWTFKDDGSVGTTGATDSIKYVSFSLGYAY